jgi:hypothetical protein
MLAITVYVDFPVAGLTLFTVRFGFATGAGGSGAGAGAGAGGLMTSVYLF